MGILDSKSETCLAPDDVHVESADREMGRNFVVVCFGAEGLRFCGRAGHEKILRKPFRGGIQSDGITFEMQNAEMGRAPCGEADFVICRRADGIVAGLEPREADKREPAIGL